MKQIEKSKNEFFQKVLKIIVEGDNFALNF